MEALNDIGRKLTVVSPAHPRTGKRIREFCIRKKLEEIGELKVMTLLGYFEFLNLMVNAPLVLTDLGGMQETTKKLYIPRLPSRENTQRPAKLSAGTKTLAERDPRNVIREAARTIEVGGKTTGISELWDGRAAERIVSVLLRGPKG